MIISFTGNRPEKLGGYILPNPTYINICQKLEKVLLELKPDKAISGMAQGVDQYAANVCIKLNIPFIAAVPFINQERLWTAKSKKAYQALLSKASEIIIVSEGDYSPTKMQIRNEWMVNNSDILIAVHNCDNFGGTFNCIQYAKSINKQIIIINPFEN